MERYFNTWKKECMNLYGFRMEVDLHQTVEELPMLSMIMCAHTAITITVTLYHVTEKR